MTERAVQLDAFATPGTILRSARKKQGLSEREAADRLNLMPNYVEILERDDYQALRSPTFARGYVKAYGRLLGLDDQHLLSVFDEMNASLPAQKKLRIETRPVQLQRTGLGVVTGLSVLLILVAVLWWWDNGKEDQPLPEVSSDQVLKSGDALEFVGGEE